MHGVRMGYGCDGPSDGLDVPFVGFWELLIERRNEQAFGTLSRPRNR